MNSTNRPASGLLRGLKAVFCAAIFGSMLFIQGADVSFGQERRAVNPADRLPADITRTALDLKPMNDDIGNACTNVIVDGGFETGGIPSTTWDPETSTNFSTPLCNVAGCGTGGGASPPFEGAVWAWFGGTAAAETATLGQTVTIAAGSTATLTFQMRIGTVATPFTDVLNVRVDGAIVQSYPEPTTAEAAYTLRTIDLSAFANGAPHQILFEYVGPGGATASYVVDNVALNVCAAAPTGFTVSGRVTTAAGAGISGARVTLTQGATVKKAITNGFGYYTFNDVTGNVTIAATHKRNTFAPLALNVAANVTNANIVAQ